MLLARRLPGDLERANQLLRQALDSAQSLGLVALARRMANRAIPVASSSPSPAVPDDLTARELDVLRLLAIGRGNADIALVLEISLNTVATHVRNILAKTGCANRTEAAAYAMRHGLEPSGIAATLIRNVKTADRDCDRRHCGSSDPTIYSTFRQRHDRSDAGQRMPANMETHENATTNPSCPTSCCTALRNAAPAMTGTIGSSTKISPI